MPRIIVPKQQQEALIRFTHEKMFHLGAAKVAATLKRSYHWPTLAQDTRRILDDCPNCEMEKARTNLAQGLFAAKPHQAPRDGLPVSRDGAYRRVRGARDVSMSSR
jgi:hypothetical protein